MKKFLAVVEFVIGGVLGLVALSDIPKVVGAFASGNIPYALGSLLGAVLCVCFAYWLIVNGRKNWNLRLG